MTRPLNMDDLRAELRRAKDTDGDTDGIDREQLLKTWLTFADLGRTLLTWYDIRHEFEKGWPVK